jgi:hypothetical protein
MARPYQSLPAGISCQLAYLDVCKCVDDLQGRSAEIDNGAPESRIVSPRARLPTGIAGQRTGLSIRNVSGYLLRRSHGTDNGTTKPRTARPQ